MTSVRSKHGALLWLILSPVFYAALSVSAKLAGGHLSVWQIGLGRFTFGILVIPFVVKALGFNLWGKNRFLLSVRGLCGSMAFLLLVAAFKMIPLSLAMVLFYLYPVFTAILSPWITGESPIKIAWLFICGAFIGTSLILWPHESSATLSLGHLFAVIASVLCAITLLLVRKLGRENNIYTLFFYLCLAGALTSLGPLIMQDLQILPVTMTAWIFIAAVALFSMAAQLSINLALVRIPATIVSVMMTVEIPLVAGFGVLFLHEPLGWQMIFGALLIFGCGIGLSLLPSK